MKSEKKNRAGTDKSQHDSERGTERGQPPGKKGAEEICHPSAEKPIIVVLEQAAEEQLTPGSSPSGRLGGACDQFSLTEER